MTSASNEEDERNIDICSLFSIKFSCHLFDEIIESLEMNSKNIARNIIEAPPPSSANPFYDEIQREHVGGNPFSDDDLATSMVGGGNPFEYDDDDGTPVAYAVSQEQLRSKSVSLAAPYFDSVSQGSADVRESFSLRDVSVPSSIIISNRELGYQDVAFKRIFIECSCDISAARQLIYERTVDAFNSESGVLDSLWKPPLVVRVGNFYFYSKY